MPACRATVTLWGLCRRRSEKAALYEFPVEPLRAWVPNWAHERVPAESPPDTQYPLRLKVDRTWLATQFPEALAKLEAGAPRRVLTERPRLLVVKESPPANELVLDVIDALRDSRLADEEAATVLGLTARQVACLRRGYLRVDSVETLQRVESALRQELHRQATVTGLPTEG